MPVLRKRNHWHGLALECLAGLEPTSLRYAMRCVTSYTIGTISRFHGLSVVATRGELSNAFRLSQAYTNIIPHNIAKKLAKFQNKKLAALTTNLSLMLSAPQRSRLSPAHIDKPSP